MSDKIPNTNHFSVPKEYFDSFKDRLDDEIKLDQLLEGSKETGFEVPEHYFSKNPERFTAQLQKPVKVIPLLNRKWVWTAASIAAIVLLTISIIPKNNIEPVTIAEMENYLLNESTYDLAELLEDDELDDLSVDLFDDDVYVDYLDNVTDAYDLYLE